MMQIRLRYFAIVREIMGQSRETMDLPEGATVGDVMARITAAHPRLDGASRSIMLMVNQEYVLADHVLADGDELALIPPVSGGETGLSTSHFIVTSDVIDPRSVEKLVERPGSGAIVTFSGVVRDHARGRSVTALDYEAYDEAAEKMLARIGTEISDRWPVDDVAIVHRTGHLGVGEISVAIAVSSAHRDAAFDACRYAIERIKEIVPIWKKEHYADGEVWIGSEADYQREIGRLPT
jgi:MoaE-MoaD fusion protein